MASSRHPMARFKKQVWQLLKGSMQGLFRWLFRYQRQQRRLSRSGFVFPTTMLLLLVVALTAGALTYRASTRSTAAILARQQQVIENAASPAIDRAKAKIEYLFANDTRSPRRVPTSDQLRLMLLGKISDGALPGLQNNNTEIVAEATKDNGLDIYTLDDEERVDLNNNGRTDDDNAWVFSTGVGNQQVIYSITIDDANPDVTPAIDLGDPVTLAKAQAAVTRNGPISTIETSGSCGGGGQRSEEGWQVVSRSRVQKNIQINAYLADPNDISGTATTLELQQVREGDRSSKWGAWFRYDLEMAPGVQLNWNGATHTQGSLLVGGDLRSFMISSEDSCLYGPGASDMTVGRDINSNGFHGQLIRTSGSPFIHRENASGAAIEGTALGGNSDSIATPTGSDMRTYENVLLDPVKMYLEDVSQHIGSGWTSTAGSAPISLFNGRVKEVDEKLLKNLSLDDIFRADNRWGPKATYGTQVNKTVIPDGTNIGEAITDQAVLTRDSEGLDGYWERQAVNRGTRLIVGERLELGNFFGWNHNPIGGAPSAGTHDGFDPLYPPNDLPRNTDANRSKFGYAEQKQRKTLRDNLAAVQGMVVYRWDLDSGTIPQACIAVTAHHGTAKAVADSRTFRLRADDSTKVMTNFLTGEGTDGWEFAPVTSISGDLATALDNLAKFAGDPNGGAPSFEPVQDSFVHPYPYLSMWGDFSMLRRIGTGSTTNIADKSTQETAACTMTLLAYNLQSVKAEYDNAAAAANAAAWQGLADALRPKLGETGVLTGAGTTADTSRLADQHARPWRNNGLTAAQELLAQRAFLYWAVERDRIYGFKSSVTTNSTVAANTLSGMPGATTATAFGSYDPTKAIYTASSNTNLTTPYAASRVYNVSCDPSIFVNHLLGGAAAPTAGTADAATLESRALTLALGVCPRRAYYPSLAYIFPVVGHGYDGLASYAVPDGNYGGVATSAVTVDTTVGTAEPYIDFVSTNSAADKKYGQTETFTALAYSGISATPREPSGTWTLPKTTATSTTHFVTDPTAASWLASGAKTTDNNPFTLVVTNASGTPTTDVEVALLDKVMYGGRENMAIRVLDLDVAKLMASDWFYGKESGTDGVEHFGLTYAFREDAVREDEIVRPLVSGGTNCATYAVLKAYDSANAGCYMNITPNALTSTDPPLEDANHKISLKPVDYAPDPDRRPYGFRLRNGANFGRASGELSGLSFITDNTLIVQGDFNLHQNSSGNTLEEFQSPPTVRKIALTAGEFYNNSTTGRPSSKLNLTNFANSSVDRWRPAELLADAVYIQSGNFKDGFASTAYVRDELGVSTTANGGKVSFENANILGREESNGYDRPLSTAASPYNNVIWREDGRNGNVAATARPGSPDALVTANKRAPVYFDRNGVAWYRRSSTNAAQRIIPVADQDAAVGSDYNYHGLKQNSGNWSKVRINNLQLAQDTTVNALLVSGVTPMRFDQANSREQVYGGLNNFPRFNESWEATGNPALGIATSNRNLFISGAFYQLFLSHTATAPYYTSSWEAQDTISGGEWYFYYQPPARIWGYDVALQYSPPHPLTSRFVSVGNARSEFYRELPVDDPYIQVLRCAKDGSGQLVLNDPNANCS